MNKFQIHFLKMLLPAALLTVALDAGAQKKAGQFSITPKAGMTVSSFNGHMPLVYGYAFAPKDDDTPYMQMNVPVTVGYQTFYYKKSKVGFTVGLESEYLFTSSFGLSLGVFYTREGAVYETKGTYAYQSKPLEDPYPGSVPELVSDPDMVSEPGMVLTYNDNMKVNLDCITLPLLANVYVWKGLSIEAGLQPEFAVVRKIKGDMSASFKGIGVVEKSSDADIKMFSLSLPVGVSYEYKGVELGVRYHFGLTNISKSYTGETARNRLLMLSLGYRFNL